MHYRTDKHGEKLSILGFGCMRFQRKRGSIDFEEAEREILSAIHQGVNYFDTAYIYPGSEELLGAVLEKNQLPGPGEHRHQAAPLPDPEVRRYGTVSSRSSCRRLKTDHIDYYLMHMLPDVTTWQPAPGAGSGAVAARKAGGGGHPANVGFSYHGDTNAFQELLDCRDWDFCQIQYNYIDEHTQAGPPGAPACGGEGDSGYHHGAPPGRPAGKRPATQSAKGF